MDPRQDALRRALAGTGGPSRLLTLEELADESGLSPALLEALARQGLLLARSEDPDLYHPDDAAAVSAGLELVSAGLPLAELLELARRADEALRPVAEAAVEVFARFVLDQVEATAQSGDEVSEGLVEAFEAMLPAAGRLVSHHFQRLLEAGARTRLHA